LKHVGAHIVTKVTVCVIF